MPRPKATRMNKPEDHAERMQQVRARCTWEFGDSSWADVILAAYLDPTHDYDKLQNEMGTDPD